MPTLKIEITDSEQSALLSIKSKLGTTKRALVREALADYFTKHKKAEIRRLKIVNVKNNQTKLNLD